MNTSIVSSVYFKRETVDLLNEMIEQKKYPNISKAVNAAVHTLNQVDKYQHVMGDPIKAAEFQAKIRKIVQNEQVDRWSKSLTNMELDGFLDYLTLEKHRR